MKQTRTRALVLSGGGTAGGAWMDGYISAVRGQGVDLGEADLIIGTSAGCRAARGGSGQRRGAGHVPAGHDRRRYADGGVHSPYNADLAASHDVGTVLTPLPLNDYLRATVDAQLAAASDAGTAQSRRDIATL